MIDFFVSYNRNDKNIALQIAQILREYGAKIWIQDRDSEQIFAEKITQAIKDANNFIVLLSKNSIESTNVFREFKMACDKMENNKDFKVIPVFLETIDHNNGSMERFHYYLSVINCLSYGDFKDLKSLVSKIIKSSNFTVEKDKKDHLYSTSDKERDRILLQNKILTKAYKKGFDKLFSEYSSNNIHILDIGCGDASGLMLKLKDCSYTSCLGVDKSSTQIDNANKLYSSDKNTFINADILEYDFLDKISVYTKEKNINGFDLITLSSVSLHLGNLQLAFDRIYRLLNDGGFLYIQDEDDGCNLVYPEKPFFEDCFFLYKHSKMSGDRKCARKIPIILEKYNYDYCSIEQCGISSLGLDLQEKEILWDMYFNPNMWGVVDEMLFDDGRCISVYEDVKNSHDNIKAEFLNGDIFIQLGFVFILAKK